MTRILLVKISSLGDVIHNLPVVSDIHAKVPDAVVDWVVEEAYVPLVRLHPGVRRVFPVAIRRWRRHLLAGSTWREFAERRRALAKDCYDVVIDTQGLLKSAFLAHLARGRRHGFDAASAREPLATHFYDVTHPVDRGAHAVARNRALSACALGYQPDPVVDYGLQVAVGAGGSTSVVLLHATSRSDKLWPERFWIELGQALSSRGLTCHIPWGNEQERARSERLAAAVPGAVVPPRQDTGGMAVLLARSRAVVGVDTGLLHLAAAIGVPVVGIYGATDPALTGIFGAARSKNLGGIGKMPVPDQVLASVLALTGDAS